MSEDQLTSPRLRVSVLEVEVESILNAETQRTQRRGEEPLLLTFDGDCDTRLATCYTTAETHDRSVCST